MNELNLREADRMEVTILVDNYTDILVTRALMYAKGRFCLSRIYFLPNTGFRA